MPMLYSEAFSNKSIIPSNLDQINQNGLKGETPVHTHIPQQYQNHSTMETYGNNNSLENNNISYDELLSQYKDLERKFNQIKPKQSDNEENKNKNKNKGSGSDLLLIGCGGLLALLLIELIHNN